MKKGIYAIYDKKLTMAIYDEKNNVIGMKEPDAIDVFFAQSDGIATRNFMDLCNDKSRIGSHAGDFYLVKIGEISTEDKEIRKFFTKMLDGEVLLTEEKKNEQGKN